jgi:hypothetical protein
MLINTTLQHYVALSPSLNSRLIAPGLPAEQSSRSEGGVAIL